MHFKTYEDFQIMGENNIILWQKKKFRNIMHNPTTQF